MRHKVILQSWKKMKEKLTEKYISEYYRNHLQGHMFIQDYIVIFENLICHCDMTEYRSQSITRFVSSLRS